jgi:hypothetical protein
MNLRRIEAAAGIALWALLGCSSYDLPLLRTHDAGALPVARQDASMSNGKPDAAAPVDAGHHPEPDAGKPATDAGKMPDAHMDAGAVMDAGGTHDAAVDASAHDAASVPDAACGPGDADVDCCPNDPAKTAPGQCGCDMADTDGDSDGTADCNDGCPQDGMKTVPGICGCGRPDTDQGAVVSCTGLTNSLVHRYRFDGSGTTITDAIGDSDGVLQSTTLTGNGQLDLAGGTSGEFVDLPNGLVSSLTDATLEVWLSWSGNAIWERIFDFGDNSNTTEGNQGTGTTYLFLTPHSGATGGRRSTRRRRSRAAACTTSPSSSTTPATCCTSTSTARMQAARR